MSEGYLLPVSKARFCRIGGAAFLIVAILWGMAAAVQAAVPGWSLACSDEHGCLQATDPATLLSEQERTDLLNTPDTEKQFAAYVAQPAVRAGLAALTSAEEGFMVFMFVSVGVTLRRLGERGTQVLAQALPWFKRGAMAALLWAIAQPVTDSLRMMLLYPGTSKGPSWSVGIDFTIAGPALLLAIAVYATAWALEAGVRAQRDLADFV